MFTVVLVFLGIQNVGLYPGIGILHSDNPGSPNLSLDVMEAVRLSLDAWFLSFLQKRVFSKNEFFEMQDGSVRLAGHLRQELSAFGPVAFDLAAPWAEFVVHTMEKEFKGKLTIGTPLTRNNRKKGRDAYRVRAPKQKKAPKIENRCVKCGKPIPADHHYCTDCLPGRREEIKTRLSTAGINHLKELREQGISPAQGGEAGRKRGESNRARSIARKEWEKANPGRLEEEKDRFTREIQPLLQAFTITEISRACGCSPRYASLMKKGEYVPHPALYEDLEKAILRKTW